MNVCGLSHTNTRITTSYKSTLLYFAFNLDIEYHLLMVITDLNWKWMVVKEIGQLKAVGRKG